MYHSKCHLERIEDLPDEAYWGELEELENQRLQRLKATKKYHETLKELQKKYLGELNSLIGEKNLPRYLKLHNRRIRNMQSMRKKVTKTPEGFKQLNAKRLHNIKETTKLVERAGIEASRIRALQEKYYSKVAQLHQDRIGIPRKTPRPLPEELEGNGWIILTAPYHDHNIDQHANSTKGRDSYSYYAEYTQETGRMKHESSLNIKDANDSDSADIECRIELAKVVRVPADCDALTIVASFENIQSFARGSETDECGWSHYYLHFYCGGVIRVCRVWPRAGCKETTTHVQGVGGGYGQLNLAEPSNGVIYAPWEVKFWTPGEAIFTPLVHFPGPYRHGEYLGVWSGLQVFHSAWVNDFSVTNDLRYELKLSGIHVLFR